MSNKMQIPNTPSTLHKPAVIKCIGRQIFYMEHKKCQAFRSNNCEHLFFKSKESKQQFTLNCESPTFDILHVRSSAIVMCLCHCKLSQTIKFK